jgi:hypothetical protein
MKFHSSILLFAAWLAFSCPAPAAIVGVNFMGGGFGGSPPVGLLPTELAGVIPSDNYNNVPSAVTASPVSLVDSDGASTPIALTITGAGLSYSTISGAGISPQGGDEKLNTGMLAGNNTLSLSGIPYAAYDIYVYVLNDNQTRVQTTTIGSLSYYHDSPNAASRVDQNIATDYVYAQATSTIAGSPSVDTNYVRFSDLTGSSKTIIINAPGNGFVARRDVSLLERGIAAREARSAEGEQLSFQGVLRAEAGVEEGVGGHRFPDGEFIEFDE